jgi:uncharacterized lipoprotein YmbA
MSAGQGQLMAAIIGTLVLASCSSAPTRVYTLHSVVPAVASRSYYGPAVRVDAIHVPPAEDRVELVRELSVGELKIYETEHWSAPLREIVKQTLSADLVARLTPGKVIFPHLAKPDDGLGLSVDVLELNIEARDIRLVVSWAVTARGRSSGSTSESITLRRSLSDPSAARAADGFSEILGELADRIADELIAAQGH